MNKKVISALLASVMSLSTLGTSVFAATATPKEITAAGQTTFKISAAVAAPVIKVSVPSNVSAVINPYGVAIKIKGQDDPVGAGGVSSVNYQIVNKTETSKIKVSVTPTIVFPTKKVDGETVPAMLFADDADKAKAATNTTIPSVYAEVIAKAEKISLAADATEVATLLASDFTEESVANTATKVPFVDVTGLKGDELTDKQNTATKGLMILAKADPANDKGTEDKSDDTPEKFGYGVFTVTGAVQEKYNWTTKDKVTLNLVLNIGPCSDTASLS